MPVTHSLGKQIRDANIQREIDSSEPIKNMNKIMKNQEKTYNEQKPIENRVVTRTKARETQQGLGEWKGK